MNIIERLENYVEEDMVYQDYAKGHTDFNDFEIFCIEHCIDINKVVGLIKRIKEYCDKNMDNSKYIEDILGMIKEIDE